MKYNLPESEKETLEQLVFHPYYFAMKQKTMEEKIFVFSDLHGSHSKLHLVAKRIAEEKATHVFFAGDIGFTQLGEYRSLFYSLSENLIIVRGNLDQPWLFMNEGIKVPLLYTATQIAGRTIAMTHGDYFSSYKAIPVPLTDRDIFISGHTHVPALSWNRNEPLLLNPGSVTASRCASRESYAVIDSTSVQVKSVEDGKLIEPFHLTFSATS